MDFKDEAIINQRAIIKTTYIYYEKEDAMGKQRKYSITQSIGLLRFMVLRTDEKYRGYLKKIKTLDLKGVYKLSDNLNAYHYGNNDLDIVASASDCYLVNKDNKGRLERVINWIRAKEIIIDGLNFSKIDSLKEGLSCSGTETIKLKNVDLSNIEDMTEMFQGNGKLKDIYFLNVIPPKKCDIRRMFYFSTNVLDNQLDLSLFDNTEIIDAEEIFGIESIIAEMQIGGGSITELERCRNNEKIQKCIKGLKQVITNNTKIKEAILNEIRVAENYIRGV